MKALGVNAVPRLALEFSVNLRYKEITHHDGGHGWTKSGSRGRATYRWEKRRMAKLSRRNGREIIAEYSDSGPDLELAALLELWVAYLLFLENLEFARVFVDFMRPACDGPGYCHICDGKE
jgi:hypothetical protein